jgi:sulfofructose kinase
MRMPRLLAIGIAVLDEVFVVPVPLRPGEKHRASAVRTVIGGNAVNAALAIARLGGEPFLVTRFGDDPAAGTIRARLAELGIDASLSRACSGSASSRSAIVIEPNGDRTIVNYLDPDLPDLPEWLPARLPEGTRAVLGDTRWETGSRHVFTLARAAGIPALFDGDRAPQDPALLDIASHVVFSARGARELAGTDDLAAALLRIAAGRSTFIAATDGGRGVFAVENGTVRHHPAFPVTPVDTLGAGDVWHGAFALALAEAMPLDAAIRFASATAAIKCTRPGGSAGTPAREEVMRLLAGQGS